MDLKANHLLPLQKHRLWKASFGMFQLQSHWMGEEKQKQNIVNSCDRISGSGFLISFRLCPMERTVHGKDLESSRKLLYVPGKAAFIVVQGGGLFLGRGDAILHPVLSVCFSSREFISPSLLLLIQEYQFTFYPHPLGIEGSNKQWSDFCP